MDTEEIIKVSIEIMSIFTKHEMSIMDSVFALQAAEMSLKDQTVRTAVRKAIEEKNNYPGVH